VITARHRDTFGYSSSCSVALEPSILLRVPDVSLLPLSFGRGSGEALCTTPFRYWLLSPSQLRETCQGKGSCPVSSNWQCRRHQAARPAAHMHTRSAHAWMSRSARRALRQIACKLPKWVSGRDPARDHLAETIMVEAVAWSVKHSKSQKLLL